MSTRFQPKGGKKSAKRGKSSKLKVSNRNLPGPSRPFSGVKVSAAPVSVGTIVRNEVPRSISTPEGMVVTHREYCFDVRSDNVFVVSRFDPINPGNSEMFPWLSGIATRFESYTFDYLRFIFQPMSGSGGSGVVLMAIDYDAADDRPDTKAQMMSYEGAVRSSIWSPCTLDCPKKSLNKIEKKFVLDHSPKPNTDIRLYNVGSLIIATDGVNSADVNGELYVEYKVRLQTPQTEVNASGLLITWIAATTPAADPFTPGTFLMQPPQNTNEYFGIGDNPGYGNHGFTIYKEGDWLWNSYMVPNTGTSGASGANVTCIDGNATIDIANIDGVIVWATALTTFSCYRIHVTQTPARFTFDAQSTVGAGHSIKANSNLRITYAPGLFT